SEVRLSFAALCDLFEGIEEDTLSQLPPPQQRALGAALLREEWTQDPVDERAVSAAVLRMLRIYSSAGPVLIAIDDVQWLDQPSARALGYAFRRLEAEQIRLLAVERHPVHHDADASFLSMLPRDMLEMLALGPITLNELDQLLRTRLDLLLLRPVLGRLQEVCDGNPFFALEIGRAMKRRGTPGTPGDPLPVPDNI